MHHIKRVAAATTEHDFEQSMYGVMGDHYGVVLRRAQQQIKAINLDERIAGLLGVNEGAAALLVKRTTVDEQPPGYRPSGRRPDPHATTHPTVASTAVSPPKGNSGRFLSRIWSRMAKQEALFHSEKGL